MQDRLPALTAKYPLVSMSLRSTRTLWEVSLWLCSNCSLEERLPIAQAMEKTTSIESNHIQKTLGDLWKYLNEAWNEKSVRLRYGSTSVYIPAYAPLNIFSIFDDFQEHVAMLTDEV